MASGSSSRGRGSGARGSSSRARAAEAPSADDAALLAPQLNPTFVAMSAADLVAHLNRFRRTDDFVDAALVFAARERRLAEAEDFARAADEHMDSLLDEIRARDYSALEAQAKIRRAAETEAALRAKMLGFSPTSCLTQQAAGHGREPVPQDFITISDDATGVQTTVTQGEVGDDVPMKMRHGALNRAAPHLAAAPLPSAAALISSGISGRGITQQVVGHGREPVPQDCITASDDATGVQTMVAQGEVGDDVPKKMRHGALNRAAPHLAAAPLPSAAALISSGISGRGLTQQAAGCSREPVPQDFITASDDATGVQTMVAQGEVGDDVPMKMRHGALNRAAPHLAAAPLPSAAALISSGSGIRGRGLTQQAAGHGREPVPQDFITASDDGVGFDDATGVQTMFAEVGDNIPRPSPLRRIGAALPAASSMPDELAERAVERVVVDASPAVRSSHQVAKAGVVDFHDEVLEAVAGKRKQEPAATSASEYKEQQPLKKQPKTAAPHLVADPLPDTLIDDDERTAEEVATDVLSCNEVAQGDHEVSEDVLRARVTAGRRKVSEEEAQGEDVAANRHRRAQGEQQAARATKKPRRLKGTCFYNEVFKALKEKEELLKKREEERLAKEAVAAASKQLHCRCWWSDAPYMPSKSEAVEEDASW
ncbi:unnamed protein product [Miscanthus lutarioriparius]|uniref:Uncharacterized protein n=1 Tax=Miscanthus lutarioriparius TaxID=422564 RepID=A0A811NEL8_9POAL|nr:unnamed protein product [Miscanthus lutarioriparius]